MSTSLAEEAAAASARNAAAKACRRTPIYIHLYVQSIDSVIRRIEQESVSTVLLHYEQLAVAVRDHANRSPLGNNWHTLLRGGGRGLFLRLDLLHLRRPRLVQEAQHAPDAGADQEQCTWHPDKK